MQHHVPVHLQHHDQGSLLAGKLHAILQREYVKGRDWYDLFWYLRQADWASPNVEMLNDALTQASWKKAAVTEDNWKTFVLERLMQLDWDRVTDDVQRFLIVQAELLEFKKVTLENLLRL